MGIPLLRSTGFSASWSCLRLHLNEQWWAVGRWEASAPARPTVFLIKHKEGDMTDDGRSPQ